MTTTEAPKRIRLSPAKGWRKPEGVVVVARPSRWGNPYRIGDESAFIGGAPVLGIDEPLNAPDVVQLYRAALEQEGLHVSIADVRRDLAGRDLACWCPLSAPCHGDVLLEIANEPTTRAAHATEPEEHDR